MPCNPKCPPGYVCKSFDGKSWCQKNKGKFKGNTSLNVKRAAGKLKRAAGKGLTRFLGKLAPANQDKKKKKKLERTEEFRNTTGAGYKLKF